jgi:hypothetical protein
MLRRRLGYLRRVRELQLRDLGGLVYETYRLARPRQDLVEAKVESLRATDAQLGALEQALNDPRPLHDLREPGIGGQCSRCGAFHGTDARFCASCGSAVAAPAPAPAVPAPPPPGPSAPAPQPGPEPTTEAVAPAAEPAEPPPDAPAAAPEPPTEPVAMPTPPPSGDQGVTSGDPLAPRK